MANTKEKTGKDIIFNAIEKTIGVGFVAAIHPLLIIPAAAGEIVIVRQASRELEELKQRKSSNRTPIA